jgi:hypothetical protein
VSPARCVRTRLPRAFAAPHRDTLEDPLSIKRKLRALFLGLILGIGSIAGMPMRPEEIQELMHSMNQTRVCQIIREEHDDAGDPPVK